MKALNIEKGIMLSIKKESPNEGTETIFIPAHRLFQ